MKVVSTETRYEEFVDVHELLAQFNKGYILYRAPLDSRPYTVKVQRYSVNLEKPEKSTVTFWTSETGSLTVTIENHFTRFLRRVEAL